jgi:hypothetical protein
MSSDKYGRANQPQAATKKPPRHTPTTRAHVFNYRKPRLKQEITHFSYFGNFEATALRGYASPLWPTIWTIFAC